MRQLFGINLLLLLILAACSKGEPGIKLDDLPQGDQVRGAALFSTEVNSAPACSSCHRTDGVTKNGPGFEGFAERAGQRVDGESAREYAYYSILRPSQHIVSGFSNIMYSDYEEKLSAQQLADLIAFVLSL